MKNKENHTFRNFIWTVFGILLMTIFVMATTTITDTSINTTGTLLSSNFNTSEDWTFVGELAGSGVSGSDLVHIGYRAGADNSDGRNTFVGSWAGDASTGKENIFLGYSAGYDSDGLENVFLGYEAGYENTGNRNTFFGRWTGYANTGDNVLGLGNACGEDNTGDNSVFIGNEAGKDNILDNQFIVKHSLANAIPLIQGNFSSGYVGIGTISPQNMLNVIGAVNSTQFIVNASVGYSGYCVNMTYLGGIATSCND